MKLQSTAITLTTGNAGNWHLKLIKSQSLRIKSDIAFKLWVKKKHFSSEAQTAIEIHKQSWYQTIQSFYLKSERVLNHNQFGPSLWSDDLNELNQVFWSARNALLTLALP